MRRLILIATVIILFCGMGTKASGFKALPTDTLHLKGPSEEQGDSLEYELVIFDPAFETWFIRNRQPESMYSQAYLENWNQQLVTQWNNLLSHRARAGCMPETYLNYEPGTDYGKTLNYQLFYYFRYMQEKCRIFSSFPARW